MKLQKALSICTAAAVLALAPVALAQEKGKPDAHAGHEHAAGEAKEVTKAIAVLAPTKDSKTAGTVTFTKQDDGILVEAHITGLTAGKNHGFHIHEFGDVSTPDGTGAGGHFNPTAEPHAAPEADQRHDGDFGNVEADDKGEGHYSRVDKEIKLTGDRSILGHAVIVHANTDDFTTQPSGNAGARIAQGVIGVAKAAE